MTYLVMQTKIADDLTRDDLNPQIKTAINEAIKTWEGIRFAFNEGLRRIDTVASQEYYDLIGPTLLNTDGSAVATGEMVLELDSITVTLNSAPYTLSPRTQQWMDHYQTTNNTGQPDSFTLYGNRLRLYPIPNAVFQLTLSCLVRLGPNPLTADADTNAWMTEGESLIRHQAEHSLFRFPLRDTEGMGLCKDGIAQAQFELERKMAAKAFTGVQRAWAV